MIDVKIGAIVVIALCITGLVAFNLYIEHEEAKRRHAAMKMRYDVLMAEPTRDAPRLRKLDEDFLEEVTSDL